MKDFDLVLDKDERILKTYRPNKKRMLFFGFFGLIPVMLVAAALIIIAVLGFNGVIQFKSQDTEADPMGPVMMLAFGIAFALFPLFTIIATIARSTKLAYCITDKRVMIAHGFIGRDFRSLPLDKIITMDVYVGPFDKLVRPNTGTVIFGSAAVNYTGGRDNNQNVFAFRYIENPYDVYREIKGFIDEPERRDDRYDQ